MKTGKKILRIFAIVLVTLVAVFLGLIAIFSTHQKELVQSALEKVNHDLNGHVTIRDSDISIFGNFPNISIDLHDVRILESKAADADTLLNVQDIFIGFDLFSLVSSQPSIKSIKLSRGNIHLVQHVDGTFNVLNALASIDSTQSDTTASAPVTLDLKRIHLFQIDVLKINEASNLTIEAFIDEAHSRFKTAPEHIVASLNSAFTLNVITGADTTFIKHKHFQVNTELDFNEANQVLTIKPSELTLENASFRMEGTVDVDNDALVDFKFDGEKSNFDLFLALAPPELTPVLQRYENAGKIYFKASVKGKTTNGQMPLVEADFGCEDAFFNNTTSNKTLDSLFFKGHFTTGTSGTLSTMEFSLEDFTARPEAGTFSGKLLVRNFESPEIDMRLRSQFDLDFLAKFLNLTELRDLKGKVDLTMNFHDIIDLNNPEKSIERLNESYFTSLEIEGLSFSTPSFHLPLQRLDVSARMDGHAAIIHNFKLKIGNSDLELQGKISDLPALIHHTAIPVTTSLNIKSNMLDIKELTSGDTTKRKPFDEQIKNLSMALHFTSSAKAMTEYKNLPVGEFFVDDLNAQLTHYPHKLHDFHADVYIDDNIFRVIDFTGMLDESDFHFSGKLKNYDLWFSEKPTGDTRIEIDLSSKKLQLDDLFAYGGENYVPEDYRHEEFDNMKIKGFAELHFKEKMHSVDLQVEQLQAKMKVHPMAFENFAGRFHYEDDHLVVQNFRGKLGKSEMKVNMNYFLGSDSTIKKRDNHFELISPRLDFDELFAYNPPPAGKVATPQEHEQGFNIYDLPFSHMSFHFDIKQLNYHRYLIQDFYAKARTTPNHYIYLDTLSLGAASGKIHMNGYFNGSNRNKIYLSPVMHFEGVDLDKLLFKFENFGQDHLVSENLHGKISGKLTGKIHVHRDLVPIIDDSEIHLDFKVTNGRLANYSALHAMSDYFRNKNLDNVLFDTLSNQLDIRNGVLSIPTMNINSSLGFIEISGKQDMNMNMEYYVRVPWKLVADAAKSKLFGSKNEEEIDNEIIYRDETKRVRFLNVKISGTPDKFDISLGKDKSKKN